MTHPEILGGYMHESCKHTWRKSYAYMTIIDLHLLIQSSLKAKQCFKDTRQLLENASYVQKELFEMSLRLARSYQINT